MPKHNFAAPDINLKPGKGMVAVIDAGHGGDDPGAQRAGISEKDLTRQICDKLLLELKDLGVTTAETRPADNTVSLQERVDINNRLKPDEFLSVHINSVSEEESPARGVQTHYTSEKSKLFAQDIQDALVADLPVTDRKIHFGHLYVTKNSKAPAILAEVGFITNSEERKNLANEEYQKKIAHALATGMLNYWRETHKKEQLGFFAHGKHSLGLHGLGKIIAYPVHATAKLMHAFSRDSEPEVPAP